MTSARLTALVVAMLWSTAQPVRATSVFEEQANSLMGLWLALDAADGSPRVLQITNVRRSDARSADIVAYFGNANGPWKEPKGVLVHPEGGKVKLELATDAGSKVKLTLESDGRFRGTLVNADSKPIALVFARSNLARVHQWTAENPEPRARARRDSVVELVYLTASNCVYCRGWEAEYTETHGKLKASLGWGELRFTEIALASYRGAVGAKDFPEYARPAVEGWLKSYDRRWFTGTPWYVLLVNNEVRCATFGTGNFESLVKPAINAALREKALGGSSR